MVLNICIGFDKKKQKEIYKKYTFTTGQVKQFLGRWFQAMDYDFAKTNAEEIAKIPVKKRALHRLYKD